MSARVAVLCGGPDAEREVSLRGGEAVAQALHRGGAFRATRHIIDRASAGDLQAIDADVFWPLLHGAWGEGGPMQDLLERDGRPYVGCRPHAARIAMDKLATKILAAQLGLHTSPTATFNPSDDGCPLPLPVVVKPVFEGSTIGLFLCRTEADWAAAHAATRAANRPAMVEPLVDGREVTAGVLDRGNGLEALPLVEIVPSDGLYDYDAKYVRNDTRYIVEPDLPPDVTKRLQDSALRLAQGVGVRHLARADFILPRDGSPPVLLEINTMPGFTDHSLVPMAAEKIGLDMPALCETLVRAAVRDGAGSPVRAAAGSA